LYQFALASVQLNVESLVDIGRTTLNVNGSMLSGTITSRMLGTFNKGIFSDKDAVVEQTIFKKDAFY
jgi:hypothetical protein